MILTKLEHGRILAPDLMNGQTMQWEDSADTFALGITLYELLTHSYPWPGKRIPILDKVPTDIMSLNSLISPDFGAFVMKAINTRLKIASRQQKRCWSL